MNDMQEGTWEMLDYFWTEKGDLTRWCGWDEFRVRCPNHPIVEAQARYESSRETISMLIRGARP